MMNIVNLLSYTIFVVLALAAVDAVQLSELFTSKDFRFFPNKIHTFRDNTVLLWASSSYSLDELNFHPIVTVDEAQLLGDETQLLTRVYAKNLTVIWATAITSLEGDVDTTIDSKGNAYMVGVIDSDDIEGPAPISVIKFAPDVTRLYTTNTQEKRKSAGEGKTGAPVFPKKWLINTGSDFLGYAKPRVLLLSVARITSTGVRYGVAQFNARTGEYLRLVQIPLSRFLKSERLEQYDFTVSSRLNVACFVLRRVVGDSKRMVVQCASLKGKHVVTRQLPESERANVISIGAIIEEPRVNCGRRRRPLLRIVMTRELGSTRSSPDGESKVIHQIVIHRLDTSTLEEVDWITGSAATKSGKLVQPMIMRIRTPRPIEGPVSILKIGYAKKDNSISILLSSTLKFRKIKQRPNGGKVTIQGQGGFTFPEIHWIFELNQERVLSTRKIPRDPRRTPPRDSPYLMWVTNFDLSPNEKGLFVYGSIHRSDDSESGPLFLFRVRRRIKPLEISRGRGKRWWNRHCY